MLNNSPVLNSFNTFIVVTTISKIPSVKSGNFAGQEKIAVVCLFGKNAFSFWYNVFTLKGLQKQWKLENTKAGNWIKRNLLLITLTMVLCKAHSVAQEDERDRWRNSRKAPLSNSLLSK